VALGKEFFADEFFAECSLPSAALGKAFAECKAGFAECGLHSAKNQNPVVHHNIDNLFIDLVKFEKKTNTLSFFFGKKLTYFHSISS